jgi:hypothetical protein
MKNFFELFKKLFAGDDAKVKIIDDFVKDLPADTNNPQPTPTPTPTPGTDPAILAQLSELKANNQKLLDMLNETKQKETDREKLLMENAKKDIDTKITELLKTAGEDGRIPVKNADLAAKYKAMLESNFENGKAIIDALPKTTVKNAAADRQTTDNPQSATPKTFADLRNAAKNEFITNAGDKS